MALVNAVRAIAVFAVLSSLLGCTDDLVSGAVDVGPTVGQLTEVGGDRLYPTLETAGVPAGWIPRRTLTTDLEVRDEGAVVEDVRIFGSIVVMADDVTVRRVEIVGGAIRNVQGSTCRNGLLIEDVTVRRGTDPTSGHSPAVGIGGYTARNVAIDGMPEGFRVGGADAGCGPVVIEHSIANIVAPDICVEWHGDGLQGHVPPDLTLRNSVLVLIGKEGCEGTSPFFFSVGDGDPSVDVERLVVEGGGYPFRLTARGRVDELNIVDNSWRFLPYLVECNKLESWSAAVVDLDERGQPVERWPVDCVDRPEASFPPSSVP